MAGARIAIITVLVSRPTVTAVTVLVVVLPHRRRHPRLQSGVTHPTAENGEMRMLVVASRVKPAVRRRRSSARMVGALPLVAMDVVPIPIRHSWKICCM